MHRFLDPVKSVHLPSRRRGPLWPLRLFSIAATPPSLPKLVFTSLLLDNNEKPHGSPSAPRRVDNKKLASVPPVRHGCALQQGFPSATTRDPQC